MNSYELDIDQDCIFDGREYQCEKMINLEDYDGQRIEYRFRLTDSLEQYDEIPVRKVTVNLG